jgi:hypothetical protein
MATIDNTSPDNPMFTTIVGGYQYKFSLADVPAHRQAWLVDVVGRQMSEIDERATKLALEKARVDIKRALML